MRIDTLTIFPSLFDSFFNSSLLGKAREKGILTLSAYDLRKWTTDKHKTTDDAPYGGGHGMVMKPEPFCLGVEEIKKENPQAKVALLTPKGELFDHNMALELSKLPGLVILCGRYEGVDERVSELVCDHEISIGDFVLAGGEVAAMVVIEAVCRLIPGVVGESASVDFDSHADGLLEYPQYTRPAEFMGKVAPNILLGGDHKKIEAWRREQSIIMTARRRPDLIEKAELTSEELDLARRIMKNSDNE